ncbi:MAG: hypothetical protein M1819_002067 [Sarea resinae]|nr:MAG: hypothetical protein M1819_002067 [Sarea resinae]
MKVAPSLQYINWHDIATKVPARNNKACRKRWFSTLDSRAKKGTWSSEEDERLRAAFQKHGNKWAEVAVAVQTRTGDQCWKRWNDTINPDIDRSAWSPEQDAILLAAIEQFGRNWKCIVDQHFPRRTALSAKNRWAYLTRKSTASKDSSPSRRSSTADWEVMSSPPEAMSIDPPGPPNHQVNERATTILDDDETWFREELNISTADYETGRTSSVSHELPDTISVEQPSMRSAKPHPSWTEYSSNPPMPGDFEPGTIRPTQSDISCAPSVPGLMPSPDRIPSNAVAEQAFFEATSMPAPTTSMSASEFRIADTDQQFEMSDWFHDSEASAEKPLLGQITLTAKCPVDEIGRLLQSVVQAARLVGETTDIDGRVSFV